MSAKTESARCDDCSPEFTCWGGGTVPCRKYTDKCQGCGKPVDGETHSCPYACEIGDNHDEDHCNCCRECASNCADDI